MTDVFCFLGVGSHALVARSGSTLGPDRDLVWVAGSLVAARVRSGWWLNSAPLRVGRVGGVLILEAGAAVRGGVVGSATVATPDP